MANQTEEALGLVIPTKQVGIGSVSSARPRGAMGSISPTDATNALDVLAEDNPPTQSDQPVEKETKFSKPITPPKLIPTTEGLSPPVKSVTPEMESIAEEAVLGINQSVPPTSSLRPQARPDKRLQSAVKKIIELGYVQRREASTEEEKKLLQQIDSEYGFDSTFSTVTNLTESKNLETITKFITQALGAEDPNLDVTKEGVYWCAAFVNHILTEMGADTLGKGDKYNRLRAKKYANYGKEVSLENMQEGDILLFGVGDEISHVGFYTGERSGNTVNMMGGNQFSGVMDAQNKPIYEVNSVPRNISNIIGVRRVTYDGDSSRIAADQKITDPIFRYFETPNYEAKFNPSSNKRYAEGGLATQTEEALGWTAEGKKFADANPVEVDSEQESTALSIADVPVFDRPMDASESDKWTGVQDELGNRQYKTIFGRTYFVRPAEDQRSNYEKIQQDIIPAVKNYLDNPTAPTKEQTIDFLKQSLGAAWETFKIPGDLAAGNKGMEDVTLGNIFELAGGTGAASTVGKVPGGDSSNTMRIFGGAKASNPPNVRDPGGIETYFSAEADSKTLENLSIDFENDPTGSMVRMMDAIEADPKKYPITLKQVVQGKWFRGRDDLMRFEIDDSDSKIVGGGVSNLISMDQDDMDAYLNDSMFSVYKKFPDTSIQDMPGEKAFTTLEDVLDHPRLYDQYPELKNAPVIVDVGYFKKNPQVEGYFDPSSGTIAINTKKITSNSELRETLIHEVQHLIQHLEGFESGTSLRNQDVLKIKKAIEGSPEYQKVLENYNTEVSDYLKNRDLAITDLYDKNKQVAFKILDIILDDFSKNTEIPVEKLYERISKGETFESIKMSVPFSVRGGSRGLIYSPEFEEVLNIAQGNVGSLSPSSSINLNRSLDNVNAKESAVPYFNLLSGGDKIDLIANNNRWHQKRLASVVNSLIKHNSELSKDFKKSLGFSAEDFISAGRSGPNLISKLYGIPHIVPPTKPKVVRNYVIYSTKRGEVEARNASARMDMPASERTPENVFIKEDTSAQDQWGEPELEKIEKGINPIKNYGPNNSQLKPRFAQGGVVNDMNNQMEMLFDEGGIADDGMRRDPVSGNEIPPGSLAEEVRDDIPAQLSEGEYVVPADVVRFFGVKYFEDLRAEAKMGLSNMEANGRIGGEPVGPSGMEENPLTPEEMAVLEQMGMAAGGFVPEQEPPQAVGNSVQGFAPGGDVQPVNNYQDGTAGLPSWASIPGASYMPQQWQQENLPSTTSYKPVQTITTADSAPATTTTDTTTATAEVTSTTGKEACEKMGMVFDAETQQCILKQESSGSGDPTVTPAPGTGGFQWEEPDVDYFSMSDEDLAKVGLETSNKFETKVGKIGASLLAGPAGIAAFGLFDSARQGSTIAEVRSAALVAAAKGNTTLADTLNKRAEELVGKSSLLVQGADYFGALSGVNDFAQQVKFNMPKGMEFDQSTLGLTENQQVRVLQAASPPGMVYQPETQTYVSEEKDNSPPGGGGTFVETSSSGTPIYTPTSTTVRPVSRDNSPPKTVVKDNSTPKTVVKSSPTAGYDSKKDTDVASSSASTYGSGSQNKFDVGTYNEKTKSGGFNKGGLMKKRKKK